MSEREKFESWAKNKSYDLSKNSRGYIYRSTACAFEGWQAALSTRKSCGFGVVDKNGQIESDVIMDSDGAERFKSVINSLEGDWTKRGPFRPVELFYEES